MGNEKMWQKVYLMSIDKDGKLLREKPKSWNEIKSGKGEYIYVSGERRAMVGE